MLLWVEVMLASLPATMLLAVLVVVDWLVLVVVVLALNLTSP
jgi:hypothetical protein